MKRRLPTPDTRLDWRDPDMPVLRYGKINGVEGTHMIKPTARWCCGAANDRIFKKSVQIGS